MATLRRRYSHPEPNPKPNPEPNPNPSPNPNPNPYANHDDPAEAMTGRLAWMRVGPGAGAGAGVLGGWGGWGVGGWGSSERWVTYSHPWPYPWPIPDPSPGPNRNPDQVAELMSAFVTIRSDVGFALYADVVPHCALLRASG